MKKINKRTALKSHGVYTGPEKQYSTNELTQIYLKAKSYDPLGLNSANNALGQELERRYKREHGQDPLGLYS